MQFSWRTFLAINARKVGNRVSVNGDNPTQWSRWSSTADLLNQDNPGKSGSRAYPVSCRKIRNFRRYRAIQQVGKVDDSFLEATTGKLSNDPVIDRHGNFLRYEILLSPAFYNYLKETRLYERDTLLKQTTDLNLPCGDVDYVRGNPSDPRSGAMVLKAAWMDSAPMTNEERAKYHTEKLLIENPSYRNSTGEATCELKEMALVGLHVARKTVRQPNWTWATWEHKDNAPDCTSQMPLVVEGDAVVAAASKQNHKCPEDLTRDYAFNAADCFGSTECNTCNAGFDEGNATEPSQCANPFSPDENRWCLDLPPSDVKGKSQLCRQVPTRSGACAGDSTVLCKTDDDCASAGGPCYDNYAAVNEWNDACISAIEAFGGNSVWSNYEMIGVQWLAQEFNQCENVQSDIYSPGNPVQQANLREQVQLHGPFGEIPNKFSRPILGNTSMESYERANCTGCHAKVKLPGVCENDPSISCNTSKDCGSGNQCKQISTDFMYWLALEAARPPSINLEGDAWLAKNQSMKGRRIWKWKTEEDVTFVPPPRGFDDPRCLGEPPGTVKASVRVFDNPTGFDSREIDLPCEHWRALPRGKGYRYTDREGTCKSVRIKQGRNLRVRCGHPSLPQVTATLDESLKTVLTLGRLRYCSTFDDLEFPNQNSAASRSGAGSPPRSNCSTPNNLLGVFPGLDELE
ncbi:hypothetical protein MK489_06775 [Myxococcota bacterium]|nr:hypothetical protein [Myxococcota bacterium]